MLPVKENVKVVRSTIEVDLYQWYMFNAQIIRLDTAIATANSFHITLSCGNEVKRGFGIEYSNADDLLFCPEKTVDITFQFSERIQGESTVAQISLSPVEGKHDSYTCTFKFLSQIYFLETN